MRRAADEVQLAMHYRLEPHIWDADLTARIALMKTPPDVQTHTHTSTHTLHVQYIPNPQLGTIWCAVQSKKSGVFTFLGWKEVMFLRAQSECSTNHISQINLVMFGLVRWGFTQH